MRSSRRAISLLHRLYQSPNRRYHRLAMRRRCLRSDNGWKSLHQQFGITSPLRLRWCSMQFVPTAGEGKASQRKHKQKIARVGDCNEMQYPQAEPPQSAQCRDDVHTVTIAYLCNDRSLTRHMETKENAPFQLSTHRRSSVNTTFYPTFLLSLSNFYMNPSPLSLE